MNLNWSLKMKVFQKKCLCSLNLQKKLRRKSMSSWMRFWANTKKTKTQQKHFTIIKSLTLMFRQKKVSIKEIRCLDATYMDFNGCLVITIKDVSIGDSTIIIIILQWFQILLMLSNYLKLIRLRTLTIGIMLIDIIHLISNWCVSCLQQV